ncbi:MAG: hypothetical protein NBV67_04110, partial [Tagaea sp.]|nr:hypothetical protein [Tagaea sp.]
MAPPSTSRTSGGFVRDFGRAALFAVPLAALAAWAWVETREPPDSDVAVLVPVVAAEPPPAALPSRHEPIAPYFGIKRPASAPPP